jgi:hypothetical protein
MKTLFSKLDDNNVIFWRKDAIKGLYRVMGISDVEADLWSRKVNQNLLQVFYWNK